MKGWQYRELTRVVDDIDEKVNELHDLLQAFGLSPDPDTAGLMSELDWIAGRLEKRLNEDRKPQHEDAHLEAAYEDRVSGE